MNTGYGSSETGKNLELGNGNLMYTGSVQGYSEVIWCIFDNFVSRTWLVIEGEIWDSGTLVTHI